MITSLISQTGFTANLFFKVESILIFQTGFSEAVSILTSEESKVGRLHVDKETRRPGLI